MGVIIELFTSHMSPDKLHAYMHNYCWTTPKCSAMAERALKKVEDQLNCSICLDVYTDPKMLHCFHVFCKTCLRKLVFRDEEGLLVLSCPVCRHITPVPANGVAGLQPAFHINHLLDIAEDLKGEKDAPARAERADNSSASLQEKVSTCCSEHANEELKLYCETCGELICFHCTLKTGKHHSHDYSLIEEAFEIYQKEIASLQEPVNQRLTSVNEVLTQFDKDDGDISEQQAAIEANIHGTINELHAVLNTRRAELISHLQQLTQRKRKDLAAQKDQAETVHAQLSSCQDFMKQSIKTDCWGEALKMKTTVLKQVQELTTTVQPDALKPSTKVDIIFSASADITTLCQRFGQVSTLGSPDPSQCHATGKGLEVGIVEQTSTAILQTCNSKGEPCTEPVTSLECRLVSEINGIVVMGSFKKLEGQNQYEISYQPTTKGRHQLHISIQGQPIRESPFCPTVTSSVVNLGAPMHTIAEVKSPWGIAINCNGEIVVSERISGHISTYTPSGKKIRTIDLEGLGLFGLCLDRDGKILVGEDTNNSLRKYSPEGQLLASVGTEGIGPVQFSSLDGIAVNSKNDKVYIADCKNHRIQVLNSDLTFSTTFGRKGKGEGQFDYPSGIACDSAGNVYVTDYCNCRIQVFTAEGKFLRMFGKRGKRRGDLNVPIGIAVDPSSQHVYISESNNCRISVFTCEGQFVTSFGTEVAGFSPRGLAVDSCGVVFVCDFDKNNAIRVF